MFGITVGFITRAKIIEIDRGGLPQHYNGQGGELD